MQSFQINSPKVTNAKEAQAILDEYIWRDFKLFVDDGGELQIGGVEGEIGNYWPRALRKQDAPLRQDFPDEDKWEDAMIDAFEDGGAEGFEAVLRDLAPLLESPLALLGVEIDRHDHRTYAAVWTVQPGGAVESLVASLE